MPDNTSTKISFGSAASATMNTTRPTVAMRWNEAMSGSYQRSRVDAEHRAVPAPVETPRMSGDTSGCGRV